MLFTASRAGAEPPPHYARLMGKKRYAILMDGGYATKILARSLGRFPTADDIVDSITAIKADFNDFDLLRIYFYDAPPALGTTVNPIDNTRVDLGATQIARDQQRLQSTLELKPDFALRLGELKRHGWKLGPRALADISATPRLLEGQDLMPNIGQKGVDLRIGLDIARLALREMVTSIAVVTGDSDFVPAFKFARREGVRVHLYTLGNRRVRRELKAHCDIHVL